jgi:hypothetical protein
LNVFLSLSLLSLSLYLSLSLVAQGILGIAPNISLAKKFPGHGGGTNYLALLSGGPKSRLPEFPGEKPMIYATPDIEKGISRLWVKMVKKKQAKIYTIVTYYL